MVKLPLRLWGCALGATLAVAAFGCGGQSKFMEDEEWSREPGPDGGAWRDEEKLSGPKPATPEAAAHELNGVRLDLTLGPKAQPNAHCSCLDVMVGQAQDAGFQWGPEVPTLSAEQMVIALRTEGAQCPAGTPAAPIRRPSIRGVERSGADVIVVIEELPVGRPLALGVVTTMPGPGGSVYLRPADHRLPYAVAPGARELCKIYTRAPQGTTVAR
jgi:hypothetical protein